MNIKNINWRRLGTIAAGAVGAATAQGIALPWWVTFLSGALAGAAVNAEKVMAKRKKPSNPFDSVDAATKVEKMKK
ncbi:MAG: hypothetical protein NW202_13545 [Nitrospira sp.]|nr:hypothetical protein [Nitrospira sp.]